jgi:hypothetical protein
MEQSNSYPGRCSQIGPPHETIGARCGLTVCAVSLSAPSEVDKVSHWGVVEEFEESEEEESEEEEDEEEGEPGTRMLSALPLFAPSLRLHALSPSCCRSSQRSTVSLLPARLVCQPELEPQQNVNCCGQ